MADEVLQAAGAHIEVAAHYLGCLCCWEDHELILPSVGWEGFSCSFARACACIDRLPACRNHLPLGGV